jgi:peroxiredoxin
MRIAGMLGAVTLAVVLAGSAMFAADETRAKAPEFTLKNYDGNEVKLADYKGKIVVLEWFNYECPFVKYHYEDASTMKDLAEKYKDKNVVWLAMNSTSHQETTKNKEFAEQHKVAYPILDDASGATGRAYGAKRTPQMFIISAEGNVVYNGAIDNAPLGNAPKEEGLVNYVDKALSELTAGKTITTLTTKPYGCTVKYRK